MNRDFYASQLAELAEGILNSAARFHFQEAMTAIEAGLDRSAAVSAWLAVRHDLVDKLRALAGDGESGAQSFIEQWERAEQLEDKTQLIALERDLLTRCLKEFSLLSLTQFRELNQLKMDRDSCVHPPITDHDDPFVPSLEKVVAHLKSAHAAVLGSHHLKGRLLLSQYMKDVRNKVVPTSSWDCARQLNSHYLLNQSDAAITSLLEVSFKGLALANDPEVPQDDQRHTATVLAMRQLYPELVKSWARQRMSNIIDRALKEGRFNFLRIFVFHNADLAESISAPIMRKIEEAVRNQSLEVFAPDERLAIARVDRLRTIVGRRLMKLPASERASTFEKWGEFALIDEGIELLRSAGSFDSGRRIMVGLTSINPARFDPSQIERLIEAIIANDQALYGWETAKLLDRLLRDVFDGIPYGEDDLPHDALRRLIAKAKEGNQEQRYAVLERWLPAAPATFDLDDEIPF